MARNSIYSTSLKCTLPKTTNPVFLSHRLPHFRYEFTEPLTNNTAVFVSKSGHKSVVIVAYWAFLQSSSILTAHMIDLSVFAGVSPSMKQVKSSLVTLKLNRSSSFWSLLLNSPESFTSDINGSLSSSLAHFKRKDFFSILGEHIQHRHHHLIQDKTFIVHPLLKQASQNKQAICWLCNTCWTSCPRITYHNRKFYHSNY